MLMGSEDAPRILVAFEFSGALSAALARQGKSAISVDLRASEAPGLHYQGDVREIAELQMWDAIFFVGPPCHQHLRADTKCLSAKIADGRAF